MTTTETLTPVVAIGDVHGCVTLLREAIWPHLGSGAELILLGDLIDRSPEPDGDRQVIELVRELQDNAAAYGLAGVTVLRGNHEQMLIEALAEDIPGDATELWEWNGGNPEFLPVAREYRGWLESLSLTAVRGDYLFVHAGVRPGVPLQEQRSEDLLWIRGPNVMQGYLDRPDLTAEVIKDGWYCTGDIARLDSDGFITITGRQSRFSKIGGEMVPHMLVEAAVNDALGAADGELVAVVTAVPHPTKGERLVVLHVQEIPDISFVCRQLADRGLPNLWIPAVDSFSMIDQLPLLGSGKLDLRQLNEIARERFGAS